MQLLGKQRVVHVTDVTHAAKVSPMYNCKAILLLLLRKGLEQWVQHEERDPPRAVPLPPSYIDL